MDNEKGEARIKGGSSSRRRRKGGLTTQSGIIIGLATVAGLGLVGKLVSILRRKSQEPKVEPKDEDVETLEAVVNGEPAAQNASLQAQVQKAKLANLEDEEPDQALANGKPVARVGSSEFADSFSEVVDEDEIPEDDQIFVRQEPVGKPGGDDDAPKDGDPLARSVGFQRKFETSHSSKSGAINIKGMPESTAGDYGGKKNTSASAAAAALANVSSEEGRKKETASTSEKTGEVSSTQKKTVRRTSSGKGKLGRKTKSGGSGPNFDPLKTSGKSLPDGHIRAHIENTSSKKWDNVNGYKVLKAASSGLEKPLEEVLEGFKRDAAGDAPKRNAAADALKRNAAPKRAVKAKLEMERDELGEALLAQDLWDGKNETRTGDVMELLNGEDAAARLQIEAAVVSSISDAEETPDGVRVHEVVTRSTLLPNPAGEAASVHSSVYHVEETDEGLKVEEVVTRSKLLPLPPLPPPPGERDFTLSDLQVLGKRRKPARRTHVTRMLPLLLRVVAVFVALLSLLIFLLSHKRISLPHLGFFY